MITFFILTAIASLLIFISLSFLTGTGKVIDTARDKINGADIIILFSGDRISEDKLREIIRGNVWLDDYEANRYLNTSAKYRRKGEKTWTEYPFNICCYEDERTLLATARDDPHELPHHPLTDTRFGHTPQHIARAAVVALRSGDRYPSYAVRYAYPPQP